jgi:site-specific DNA recombinase
MIRAGKAFADISRETGTSKRRIQQMLDLAFLAPDIIREVMEGRQPLGYTSDWCLRHELPSGWRVQRDLIATL